jgi:hypothetical protein
MNNRDRVGTILRTLASGGWADQDPDVLRDLLVQAEKLADLVVTGQGSSADAERTARAFLAQLSTDTLGPASGGD